MNLPNIWLVLAATITQFILGALWYSVFFGKTWAKIMGMDRMSESEMKKMQKEMSPFYAVEFISSGMTTYALALAINFYNSAYSPLDYIARLEFGITVALIIWIGFIVPTQISGVIWANTKQKFWLQQISIMAGMKLIGFLIATTILSL